ncbi:Y-family DNA polymerase [Motiliproteus sediminis]|uniref:Y-family DNA polymerase n=1 Tax=Motiliproteus sediminis TaxID=1468178 RepID=UPI001AEFF4A3|nr:DNA polymerase Y family protein [Motiliproteus sediminis]
MSLYLALQFPLLPLEVCYSSDTPGPAALCEPNPPRIQLCNQLARAQGVEPHQSVASALARCPELQLCTPCPSAADSQWRALGLWAGHFSARVALVPPCGLLLEIASMARYFGSLEQLYQRLMTALQPLQFSVNSATGPTPEGARLLAITDQGLCLDPRQLRQRLEALALHQLPLPQRQLQQLAGMGLRRVGQLLDLPRNELAQRFGPGLTGYLDRLCGHQPDPPTYLQPPARFRRHQILNHEVTQIQALLFPLRRLLAELEGYLRQTQLRAAELGLTLHHRDQHHRRLLLAHRCGEQSAGVWLELWRLRLERETLTQPVIELTLEATRLSTDQTGTADLFVSPRQEDPQLLISRLQTRLGHAAVQGLALTEDHRPEYACCQRPPKLNRPAQQPLAKRRPSWLLAQPPPLAEPPSKLAIELLSGPERISSGWWQQWVRRDYFLGRWPDGRLGWLFRDDHQRWYLHGWFG